MKLLLFRGPSWKLFRDHDKVRDGFLFLSRTLSTSFLKVSGPRDGHKSKICSKRKQQPYSRQFSFVLGSICCSHAFLLSDNTQQCTSSRRFSTSVNNAQLSKVSDQLIFADFPTIQAAESFIGMIHNVTGLPWWSTIIVSAFFLRILLPLPLSVYSMHNAVRLQRLQPEINGIATRLRQEVSMAKTQFGWDQQKAKGEYVKNLKRHLKNLYIRDNCHPMKDTASFWIRIPLWVSASYALRNMSVRASNPFLESHESCQGMSTEGIGWFVDLTLVDSTLILPIMMGAVTLLNIEIGRRNVAEVTTYRKVLTFGLRGLALVFIPISAYLPSSLVLYWVCSGFFSAMQMVMIDRSTTFRRMIGIKIPPQQGQ